jgi:hypothetical protein
MKDPELEAALEHLRVHADNSPHVSELNEFMAWLSEHFMLALQVLKLMKQSLDYMERAHVAWRSDDPDLALEEYMMHRALLASYKVTLDYLCDLHENAWQELMEQQQSE